MTENNWWEYPTNFSNGTSVDGPGSLFMTYPSFLLNDWFGAGITLIIFLISFGLSMASGARKSLATASFIAFMFSIYFVRLGALNIGFTVVLLILTIIGALGSKSESNY